MSLITMLAAASPPIQWLDLGLTRGIDLGFFMLRWYSLAYLAAILLGYWQLTRMIKLPGAPMAQRHVEDIFFYCTLGIILGGRLGYATFYAPELWSRPSELIKLWNGGMSFHGGFIGATLAVAWVAWRGKLDLLRLTDHMGVLIPVGLIFGRLANFVNGELWGKVAGPGVQWAMVFPEGGPLARHPSQLYQMLLEGVLLAAIMLYLFWKTNARYRRGLLTGIGLVGLGVARFVAEIFREPDAQLSEFAVRSGFSMGQWLTMPLIALGLFFLFRALTSKGAASAA